MKRWLKYVKPYKTYFILGPLCMIVEVIGEVLLPKLLSSVINSGNAGTLTIGGSVGTSLLMPTSPRRRRSTSPRTSARTYTKRSRPSPSPTSTISAPARW